MKLKQLFLILMILTLSLSAFAQNEGTKNRIIIDEGLIKAEQLSELRKLADSVSTAYNFDLVIAIGGIGSENPKEFADSFFEKYGYGFGPDRDGCFFLVYMTSGGDADYRYSESNGRGKKILTDTAFNKMDAGVQRFIMKSDLYGACRSFILDWEKILELEANGRSYNFFYRYNVIMVIISWILAMSIGLVVVLIWKSQMNTALAQTQADAYTVKGSLAYNVKKDSFLYSNVVKTKRQTQSSSGSLSSAKGSRRR